MKRDCNSCAYIGWNKTSCLKDNPYFNTEEKIECDFFKYQRKFEIESNGIWEWRKKQLTWRELCEILNQLYEDNEQLKLKITDYELEKMVLEDEIENLKWVIEKSKKGHKIVDLPNGQKGVLDKHTGVGFARPSHLGVETK